MAKRSFWIAVFLRTSEYNYSDVMPDYAWGFYPYYRDILTCQVWDDQQGKYIGMDEDKWKYYGTQP